MNVFERIESEVRGDRRAYPAVFATAKNARQTDENGREYIDFFAGAGVLNFGHNHEGMTQAIIEYLQKGGVAHSLDMYTVAKRQFLERFEEVILKPRGMDYRVQFTGPTGTNAVEASLKLARKVTGRRSVVAYTHGFHGMTLGSLACTTNNAFRKVSGVPLEHVHHFPFGCEERCAGCELGCGLESVDRLRALFDDSSSGVEPPAAFLVETIQAEGGVRVASAEWLQATRKLARDVGALFIVDDIQVGCGRTGSYFSFEGMDLDPDVVCLAKGIGGFGLPLAVLLIKPERDQWNPGEHTGTFRGQNLSMVAGTESLRYFEDDALGKEVRRMGAHTDERLRAFVKRHGDAGITVRGRGMIHGLEFGDGERAKRAAKEAFERGLIVATCGTGGSTIKVIAPLTIEQETLDEGLDVLEQAVEAAL